VSSILYYLGAIEAERAVSEEMRGSGPEPAAPAAPARRAGLGAALVTSARTAIGAAMIRAGAAVRGGGDAGPVGRAAIGPGRGGQA
jgi:hypothetical protein